MIELYVSATSGLTPHLHTRSAVYTGATRLLVYGAWGQRVRGPGHQWGWEMARKHGTAAVLWFTDEGP